VGGLSLFEPEGGRTIGKGKRKGNIASMIAGAMFVHREKNRTDSIKWGKKKTVGEKVTSLGNRCGRVLFAG